MLFKPGAIAAFCAALGASTPLVAAEFNFCWIGANGYTMTGYMQVPDAKMTQPIITEADVTAFKIVGYLDGQRVGSWNLVERTADTTWHLRFDPDSRTFLTGGSFGTDASQGWNADGAVRNCGNPGFGFNSGNFAQDVCVNGAYMRESSIVPDTPFVAGTGPVDPTCGQENIFSKHRFANQ